MKSENIIDLRRLYLQTTSNMDEGTQLELIPANEDGDEINLGIGHLGRFVSKKEGEILFEVYYDNKIITFPVEELEKSIEVAKNWVKSEAEF